ncbi:MAG: hypothetical protein AAFU50_07435, partial [Pseudomonadota bacterium]
PGERNGEKARHSNNTVFSGETTGVGQGIDHLWLLGDTEYYRTTELPERYGTTEGRDSERAPIEIVPFFEGETEFTGVEDTAVAGRIVELSDPRLPIDDFTTTLPPSVGAIDFQPDGSFTFTPAPHVSGVVTIPFSFRDRVTEAPTTGVLTVDIAPVADAPIVAATAVGPEDSDIPLDFDISLVDDDGSEIVSRVEITNIPPGAVVNWPPALDGVVVQNPDGSITVTGDPADVQIALTSLTLTPPADFSGDIPLQIAVSTSEVGADPTVPGTVPTATTVAPLVVTVTPVADLPVVAGQSTTDEDTPVGFGADIAIPARDATDGSERITEIALSDIPADAAVTFTPVGGVTVTPTTVAGVTTYVLTGGTEADLRDTLSTFTLAPPEHSDANIPVSVSVTKNDDGVVATSTGTHDIIVAAVADPVALSGAATGLEDTPIDLPVTVDLIDTDGSESYDFADVIVPPGVTLTHDALPSGIIALPVSGGIRFTPGASTSPAAFEAFLQTGIQVQPPADSDIDFTVSITIGTLESVLSGGEVSVLTNTTTLDIPVAVTPVVDEPTITGDSTVDEDGTINFGADIIITQADTDGSQAISEITVGNLPSGLVPIFSEIRTASVVVVGGVLLISGNDTDDILATLATLTLDASDPAYA